MKKVIVIVLVALLVSMVSYGQSYWTYEGAGNVLYADPTNLNIAIGAYDTYGYRLYVNGSTKLNGTLHQTSNAYLALGSGTKVGIGTTSPDYKLHVVGKTFAYFQSNEPNDYALTVRNDAGNGCGLDVYAGYGNNGGTVARFRTTTGTKMIIKENGNIGIGTDDPGSYKLAVNGHIRTKEITVESGWSDFVFNDNYSLMPLNKLEQHIKTNKSLPGIPTEKEVAENGIEVGEMQAKLLEKVEELTLYLIELKKENETLKKRIDALEN